MMISYPSSPSNITATLSSTTVSAQKMSQQTDTGIPDMRRGVAIGIGACILLLVIASVVLFLLNRRKKVMSKRPKPKDMSIEAPSNDIEPPEYRSPNNTSGPRSRELERRPSPRVFEKPPLTPGPPKVHEMDSHHISELPGDTVPLTARLPREEPERDLRSSMGTYTTDAEDEGLWKEYEAGIDIHDDRRSRSYYRLPSLLITSPVGYFGDVSPIRDSQWDTSMRSNSPHLVSPIVEPCHPAPYATK